MPNIKGILKQVNKQSVVYVFCKDPDLIRHRFIVGLNNMIQQNGIKRLVGIKIMNKDLKLLTIKRYNKDNEKILVELET